MLQRPGRGPECRRRPECRPRDALGARRRPSRPAPSRAEFDVRTGPVAALEAALFCADEPLSARRLAGVTDSQRGDHVLERIRELESILVEDRSPLEIVELAGGFQLVTRLEYYPWLARLRQSASESNLTPALLETLAIIAYRQPMMRADLEAIRGVHCGDALRELMERGLVRIAGRHDSLGRPILYGTSKRFLQLFGLRDLGELPSLEADGKSAGVH